MQKLKDLIKKKKLDKRFSKLGGGHQLGGGGAAPSPTQQAARHAATSSAARSSRSRSPSPRGQQRRTDAELIAAAAEKRMHGNQKNDPNAGLTPMQKMVRMQAKKELENEQRRQHEQQTGGVTVVAGGGDEQQGKQRRAADDESAMRFTCEIFDDDVALPKSEMYAAIESTLYEHMVDEPLSASVWLVHTFCRDEERRCAALDTIRKYVQNIIDNPTEQKFLQIRLNNRVFMDKVLPVKGTLEFLKALGFREQIRAAVPAAGDGQSSSSGTGTTERYLVIPSPPNVAALRDGLSALLDGKPIAIRVFRDLKVFRIEPNQQQLPTPEIPADFFKRTVEEIKREQQQMTADLEQMMMLRTRKMREADAKRKEVEKNNPFKYCYIRVRFPNDFLLQGIFNVYEKFAAVREFVVNHLAIHHGTFTLTATFGTQQQQQLSEEQHTLLDYALVPAALIHFQWDTETRKTLEQTGQPFPYLMQELESHAQPLH